MKTYTKQPPASLSEMTLRDYFAGQAIQGLMADSTNCCDDGQWEHFWRDNADSAYEMADAMMEARK